jgi:hypothetical protein
MMDAGTALYRALMIRAMLERYKNRLVGSRERVEENRQIIGESLYLADARATAGRLIQMYDNDIRQAEEAIGWLKDMQEEINVAKRKGNETGIGVEYGGVKINVAR